MSNNCIEELDDTLYELINSDSAPYFLFRCNKALYAIDAHDVIEVVEYQKITKVPLMEEYILGVTNIRGEIIPVIDFNQITTNQKTKIDSKTSFAILNFNNKKLAIMIDEIFEVDGLDKNSLQEVPPFGTAIDPLFIKMLARYDEQDILVVETSTFFTLDSKTLTLKPQTKTDTLEEYKLPAKIRSKVWEDDLDEDEDELDLIHLIENSTSNEDKYFIFKALSEQYYGINLQYVEEVLPLGSIHIEKNFDDTIILGVVNFRDSFIPIVCFDSWIDNTQIDINNYEEIIVISINATKVAIAIKESEMIETLVLKEHKSNEKIMNSLEIQNSESSFICSIINPSFLEMQTLQENRFNSSKQIIILESNKLVQDICVKRAKQYNLNLSIHSSAEELLNALMETQSDTIDTILINEKLTELDETNIISTIRTLENYQDTKVLVYLEDDNNEKINTLYDSGASEIIANFDLESLNKILVGE